MNHMLERMKAKIDQLKAEGRWRPLPKVEETPLTEQEKLAEEITSRIFSDITSRFPMYRRGFFACQKEASEAWQRIVLEELSK